MPSFIGICRKRCTGKNLMGRGVQGETSWENEVSIRLKLYENEVSIRVEIRETGCSEAHVCLNPLFLVASCMLISPQMALHVLRHLFSNP
ncbi:uncharacterized protein LOC131152932 isoform X1 [Malania oleifera]|uniref:uncharacterized protein LOC131152932 isoform X1 n=1 Tax=Malania oleifera TaxID=397392 RepID=UPI0025AE8882|nr:uncharacterized protein LOC131152932 isoform X1 [Malania oleifera]